MSKEGMPKEQNNISDVHAGNYFISMNTKDTSAVFEHCLMLNAKYYVFCAATVFACYYFFHTIQHKIVVNHAYDKNTFNLISKFMLVIFYSLESYCNRIYCSKKK